MAKYYVSSGDIQEIVIAETVNEAFIKAFVKSIKPDLDIFPNLGEITKCSETGFDSDNKNDMYIKTNFILEDAGLLEFYK